MFTFFGKTVFVCVLLSFCFADTQVPLKVDEQNSTNVQQGGRQLGVISFLQKILPTQDSKTYASYPIQQRCPLCDSSVYSYCGERLLHDACCCTNRANYHLPYQCTLADCSFLHANTCRDHRLISNCCCSDEYRSLLKTLKH